MWQPSTDNSSQQPDALPPTKYLGEYTVITSDSGERVLSKDSLHIFVNNYSFINLEEKYLSTGGAFGAKTFYLWKLIVPEKEEDKALEED